MKDTLLLISVIVYFYLLICFFLYCARFIYLCWIKPKYDSMQEESEAEAEAEAEEIVEDINDHMKNYRIK